MTKISAGTIEEFRRVVLEEYGRELTFPEASEILTTLTNYFDLLAKLYHRQKSNNDNDEKARDEN